MYYKNHRLLDTDYQTQICKFKKQRNQKRSQFDPWATKQALLNH